MTRTKNAQMEIMGLAMIVILISLGMLFLVKFNLTKKAPDTHASFTKSELSSNFLKTMLVTTSEECYGQSFAELFQECAKGSSLEGENLGSVCHYATRQTRILLDNTFKEWSQNYTFSVFINPSSPLAIIEGEGGCPSERKSRTYPLPLGTSTLNIKMDVC